MENDLKKRITEYIDKCRFCTIATMTADGQPNASTVFFNNVGMDIYFNTDRDSKKIRNLPFESPSGYDYAKASPS